MSNIFGRWLPSKATLSRDFKQTWREPTIARKALGALLILLNCAWTMRAEWLERKHRRQRGRMARAQASLWKRHAQLDRLTVRWLLYLLLLLPGCAGSQPPPPALEIVEAPSLYIPAPLLMCPPEPVAPDPALSTQRDVAVYIVDLSIAGQACRRRLDAVRELYEGDRDGVE